MSIKTEADNAVMMSNDDLLDDLKESIMVALTDIDRCNAYNNLYDAIVDIDEIESRLNKIEELEGRVETYRKWYHNEHDEVEKLKAKLEELAK